MSDLQSEIPEPVKYRLDDLLGPAGCLVRRQESNIDIAMRRHLAPAITADSHNRDPLARRRIADRILVVHGDIVDQPHQLIDQKGLGRGHFMTSGWFFQQAFADLGAPPGQRVLQQWQDLCPGLGHALFGDELFNLFSQRPAIDNIPLTDDPFSRISRRSRDIGAYIHPVAASSSRCFFASTIFAIFAVPSFGNGSSYCQICTGIL